MANQISGAPYLNSYGVQDAYRYNGELPPEVAVEQQALNRKQQIANLLLQRGLQSPDGQMVGRFYVAPSWSQGLAQLASAGAGVYLGRKNDAKRADLERQSVQALTDAVKEYQAKTAPATTPTTAEVDSQLVPNTFDIEQIQPDNAAARERVVNAYAQQLSPGELANGRLQQELDSGRLNVAPPPSQMPETRSITAGVTTTPRTPEEQRQAMIDLMANRHPQAALLGRLLMQQQGAQDERQAQRDFQATQNEENRTVRREGIEANALGRVEQMKQNAILTQMQIDARERAGQDANDLKKALADQQADLKRMELETKREVLQQGKVPAGYRTTPEGNLQAIPGGPADTKLQGALNADTAMLQGTNASMDRLATAANALMNHPGVAGITGLRGKMPDVPGTDAANARADLNNLKSQIAFTVMQELRSNSKSGSSGLGALSDAEGKRLEAAIASLDTTQDIGQFKQRLQAIIDYANGAKDRLRDAFNMKHKTGEPIPMAPSSQGPAVGTIEGGYRFKGGNPNSPENWEKVP